jgi:hypothetical protein
MGPMGYRYGEEEGFWEVDVYSTPVELVGGAADGEVVVPGFSLDLEGIRGIFDEITFLGWQSLSLPPCRGSPCLDRRHLPGTRGASAGAGVRARGRRAGDEIQLDQTSRISTTP